MYRVHIHVCTHILYVHIYSMWHIIWCLMNVCLGQIYNHRLIAVGIQSHSNTNALYTATDKTAGIEDLSSTKRCHIQNVYIYTCSYMYMWDISHRLHRGRPGQWGSGTQMTGRLEDLGQSNAITSEVLNLRLVCQPCICAQMRKNMAETTCTCACMLLCPDVLSWDTDTQCTMSLYMYMYKH
jgi:hypothetical protein